MSKIGFIGAGNMGAAMIEGIIKKNPRESIIFTEATHEKRKKIHSEYKIDWANSNSELTKDSKYIILAVKPQVYANILKEIKEEINPEKIVISITPGITIENMKEYLGSDIKVVRAMPNTPALIGEGMSCVSFSDDSFAQGEIDDVTMLFSSLGEVEIIEEMYMDAIVPISGSSPAYVYMMIEAMADAGVLTGLPRKLSYRLAAQSILGASKMVIETGLHPGELKDAVCSPAGTTIEAVSVLEKRNFRNAVIEAMIACYDKTKKIQ